MSKKTRWIIFYIAVIVFFAASYVTVVFALGYQYDFSARAFVRMGSFRVVANTDADVSINDKRVGSLSFLGHSFSKGRLLPRSYTVRLHRDGYHEWKKNVEIVAGRFEDFPKVVLLPEKFEKEIVPSSSFGFPMPDSNIRVTKGKSLAFDAHSVSVEWLDGTDYQPFHKAGDFETLFSVTTPIDDVQWYRDHEHVFVSSAGALFFYEIDPRGNINSYKITDLSGPFWYDADENSVYVMEGKNVVRLKL